MEMITLKGIVIREYPVGKMISLFMSLQRNGE